jgi:hypothetical protein
VKTKSAIDLNWPYYQNTETVTQPDVQTWFSLCSCLSLRLSISATHTQAYGDTAQNQEAFKFALQLKN